MFLAIGHVPNTEIFKGVINMDEAGYIVPVRGAATNGVPDRVCTW